MYAVSPPFSATATDGTPRSSSGLSFIFARPSAPVTPSPTGWFECDQSVTLAPSTGFAEETERTRAIAPSRPIVTARPRSVTFTVARASLHERPTPCATM